MKIFAITFLTLMPFSLFAQSLEIEGAYAFQPNPAAKNGAIFMRIDNLSDEPVRIVDVKSDAAHMVQLHTNEMDGDVMKMAHLANGLEIPAEGCAILERGGYHVMLMGLTKNLEEGDNVEFQLLLENGDELNVEAPVEAEPSVTDEGEECVHANMKMNH